MYHLLTNNRLEILNMEFYIHDLIKIQSAALCWVAGEGAVLFAVTDRLNKVICWGFFFYYYNIF